MLLATAAEARRVALVIGNAAYGQNPLANPVNDAEAIGDALRDLGFAKVIRAINASKAQMEKALGEMATESVGAEMAVVFFAGHGTERDGRNYLIPVDAKLDRASDLDLQAIALPTVLDQIAGASKLKLVILDACRNNVFPLAGNRRSAARGLARIEPEDNTLVAYSAKDGTTAIDSTGGRHSPFTAALLKHLPTPGLEVRFLLAEVRDDVANLTQNQQTPHHYGTLGREKFFLAALPKERDRGPSAITESEVAAKALDDARRARDAASQEKATAESELAKAKSDRDAAEAFRRESSQTRKRAEKDKDGDGVKRSPSAGQQCRTVTQRVQRPNGEWVTDTISACKGPNWWQL